MSDDHPGRNWCGLRDWRMNRPSRLNGRRSTGAQWRHKAHPKPLFLNRMPLCPWLAIISVIDRPLWSSRESEMQVVIVAIHRCASSRNQTFLADPTASAFPISFIKQHQQHSSNLNTTITYKYWQYTGNLSWSSTSGSIRLSWVSRI